MLENFSEEPSDSQGRHWHIDGKQKTRNIPMFFDYCEENPSLGNEILIDTKTLEGLLQDLKNLTKIQD